MEEEKSKNSAKHFFLGAAIGAAVGTIVGILTAPKSGKETREDLNKKGREALKNVKKQGEKIKAKVAPAKVEAEKPAETEKAEKSEKSE